MGSEVEPSSLSGDGVKNERRYASNSPHMTSCRGQGTLYLFCSLIKINMRSFESEASLSTSSTVYRH